MKIRSFGNGNYKKFYQKSFAKIDSFNTEYLILDLRDNTGGRLDEIDKLYSYLTDKNYQLIEKAEVLTRQPYLTSMLSKNSPVFIKIGATLLSPFMAIHNLFKSKKKEGKKYYSFSSSKVKKLQSSNTNQAVITFEGKDGEQLLISDKYKSELLELASNASTREAITKQQLEDFKISLPPLKQQQKIVSEIEKIEVKITALEKEIANIPKEKEAILKKYL